MYRSPKCWDGPLFVFGRTSPGSAGVPPAPYSCNQSPIHGHSLARRTKPAFRVLFHRAGVCAGGTPALPGGLWREFGHRLRSWPCRPSNRPTRWRSNPCAGWRSWYITEMYRSPKCWDGPLFVFGRTSPGSAGVPPAPYSCNQSPIHGHSLARRTKPAFRVLFHRAGVCAGGTPALPGGVIKRYHFSPYRWSRLDQGEACSRAGGENDWEPGSVGLLPGGKGSAAA